MYFVLVVSIVLVLIILGLTILAISRGYAYKHTIDELDGSNSLDGNLEIKKEQKNDVKDEKRNERG